MLRDNSARAKKAISFLYVMIVVGLIGTALLMIKMADASSFMELSQKSSFERIWDFVVMVMWVLNAVFVIQWFRRAYFNLHTLRPEGRRYSEGMAAGCWWIPVANWFIPYQIMNDLWQETRQILPSSELEKLQFDQKYKLISLWWGLYVVSSLVGIILGVYVGIRAAQGNVVIDLTMFMVISVISSIINVAAGVIFTRIIKGYSELEVLLALDGTEQFSDFGVPEKSDNWEKDETI